MLEHSIGRDVALGATSLLMLGGTLLQARPIQAENPGKNTPNLDNPHSLYIDNPGLVNEAIENTRLNIPDTQSCPGFDESTYRPRIRFTDKDGTSRFWGGKPLRSGIPPNNPNRSMTTIDNWNLDSCILENYIQSNEVLDPETAIASRVPVAIEGIAVEPALDKAYILKGIAKDPNIFIQRAESFSISSAIRNPIDGPLDFSTHVAFNNGLPQGGTAGNRNTLTLRNDGQSKSLEVQIMDSVNPSEDGIYDGRLNNGIPEDWRRRTTATGTATPTATVFRPTSTAEPTRTSTSIPTSTVTPTEGSSSVGGQNFGITTESSRMVRASWNTSTTDRGYLLVKITENGTTVLPRTGPLPGTISIYRDTEILNERFACYMVLPMGLNGPMGNSDLLCAFPRTQSGTSASEYTIRLNQSNTANLSWRSVLRPDAYVLVPFGREPVILSGSATGANHDTRGAFSCYTLVAFNGSQTFGNTDVVCGLPGISNLH